LSANKFGLTLCNRTHIVSKPNNVSHAAANRLLEDKEIANRHLFWNVADQLRSEEKISTLANGINFTHV
jgi:hypothetical protein